VLKVDPFKKTAVVTGKLPEGWGLYNQLVLVYKDGMALLAFTKPGRTTNLNGLNLDNGKMIVGPKFQPEAGFMWMDLR